MKPAPRLATFVSSTVIGSGVAVVGAATAWYRTVQPSRVIDSSLGVVRIGGAVHSHSPSDLGSPLLPITVLCLVCALLALLVGPRVRTALLALVIGGAIAVVALSFTVKKPIGSGGTVHAAPGRFVTPIGAAVALAAAGAALPLSAGVRRVRMPESGPEE